MKDEHSFLILLPKIATRNNKFRERYFYQAGCYGSAFMVDALFHKIQPNERIVVETLYDALNHNNAETVQFLAPCVKNKIAEMVSTHVTITRNLNIENIRVLKHHMKYDDFDHMVFQIASDKYDMTNKLDAIWNLVEPERFFAEYTLERLAKLFSDRNRNYMENQYELFTARSQKTALIEH